LAIQGKQSVDDFHKRLGKVLWDHCGMSRNGEGLTKAKKMVQEIRDEFWKDLKVPGAANELNQELEKAVRLADFLELGELMIEDALNRKESCGGHFREEYRTEEGEARRDDENYTYVAAWEFKGTGQPAMLHKEELVFENVELKQRSYK